MKIDFIDIGTGEGFFNPALKVKIKYQFTEGTQALINAFGYLTYKEKIIGKLEIFNSHIFNSNIPNFPIKGIDSQGNVPSSEIDLILEFEADLEKRVVKFINDERRSAKNGDVHLEAELNFSYLESSTKILDAKGDLNLQIGRQENLLSSVGSAYLVLRTASRKIPIPIKASDWINDFAPKLGLGEYEIIEIKNFSKDDLPRAKDFNEVLEKINQANNKLLERKSPEDILTDLRSAWDIFDMYHRENIDEINKLIGGKSKKEEKEPSKEDRIEDIHSAIKEYLRSINELKKKIDKFTQIGAHREIYYSTMEDAELGFRLTTSLIAYYSNILSKITGDGENE